MRLREHDFELSHKSGKNNLANPLSGIYILNKNGNKLITAEICSLERIRKNQKRMMKLLIMKNEQLR